MIRTGEKFHLPEEGISGIITNVFQGNDGLPAAIVIEMDDGRWAFVDLSKIVPRVLH